MGHIVLLILLGLVIYHYRKGRRAAQMQVRSTAGRTGRGACSRCQGTGRYAWSRRAGGVCFRCRGEGREPIRGRGLARV